VSDSLKPPNAIPNTIIDLLVSDIFEKNGVNVEDAKKKLTDEQKVLLKNLVDDLSQQVDQFVNANPKTKGKEE
jgi:spore coat protein W